MVKYIIKKIKMRNAELRFKPTVPNFKVQAVISMKITDIVCLKLFPYYKIGWRISRKNLCEFLRPFAVKLQNFLLCFF